MIFKKEKFQKFPSSRSLHKMLLFPLFQKHFPGTVPNAEEKNAYRKCPTKRSATKTRPSKHRTPFQLLMARSVQLHAPWSQTMKITYYLSLRTQKSWETKNICKMSSRSQGHLSVRQLLTGVFHLWNLWEQLEIVELHYSLIYCSLQITPFTNLHQAQASNI